MSAGSDARAAAIAQNNAMLEALGITAAISGVTQAKAQTDSAKRKRRQETDRMRKQAAYYSRKPPAIIEQKQHISAMQDGSELPADVKAYVTSAVTEDPHKRPEGDLEFEASCNDEDSKKYYTDVVAALVSGKPVPSPSETPVDWSKAQIRSEFDVVKAVPQRIYSMAWYPSSDTLALCAGDKWGRLGVWLPDCATTEDNMPTSFSVFSPHSRPISGMVFQQRTHTSVITCSYDGSVRRMNLETNTFDEVFAEDGYSFAGVDASPTHTDAIYAATSYGDVLIMDMRCKGKDHSVVRDLHPRKIRTVHFHPDGNTLLTASLDQTAALWDVRKLVGPSKSQSAVATLQHTLGLTSAYFSNQGDRLVTTCNDDFIRIYNGTPAALARGGKAAQPIKVKHNNQTGRWLTPFRAVFDPRTSDRIVVGSMNRPQRQVEIISGEGKYVARLQSEHLTAVASLNAIHPTLPVMGSCTGSGRLHIWRV